MKRKLACLMLVLCCSLAWAACAEDALSAIMTAGTTQAFTDEAVLEADLTAILEAGLNAASAINQQPWHFAVVTDRNLMTEIAESMSFGGAPVETEMPEKTEAPAAPPASTSTKAALGDSPVAVVIYMDESTASPDPNFDCGLACQNMVIAASALGYGTKIVSAPTMALNGEKHDTFCEQLGVDKPLNAVAVLLIGHVDGETDGASGASVRSAIADKVSFAD